MNSHYAVQIVRRLAPGEDGFDDALADMQKDSSAYNIAGNYGVQHAIEPHETRSFLIRMLDVHRLRLTHGIGQHLMRTWPSSYR